MIVSGKGANKDWTIENLISCLIVIVITFKIKVQCLHTKILATCNVIPYCAAPALELLPQRNYIATSTLVGVAV